MARSPDYQRDGITLYLGDCAEILPELHDIDAVVTDPPYEIVATGGGMFGTARRQYLRDIKGFTDCGFDVSLLEPFKNWIVWGTLKQVPGFIEAAGKRSWMLLTWNKANPTPLCGGNYLPDTEYAVHAWSKGCLHGDYHDKARFFHAPTTQGKVHPNEKPLPLMEKCVRVAVGEAELVCDPFMGSGTTGVACVKNNRRFIGVEKDPVHFATSVKRITAALDAERNSLFPVKQQITQVQKPLF